MALESNLTKNHERFDSELFEGIGGVKQFQSNATNATFTQKVDFVADKKAVDAKRKDEDSSCRQGRLSVSSLSSNSRVGSA